MVEVRDNGRNRLTLLVSGNEVGLIDYLIRDDVMTAMHTEVYPEYNGKGYAKFLVQSFLGLCELYRLKQGALCPYAVKYFEKHNIENHFVK